MDTQPLDQARTMGCLAGPPGRLQRRYLLQAAAVLAGAGLAACGRRAAAPSRAPAAALITLGVAPPLPAPAYRVALEDNFAAANPGFRIVESAASVSGVSWWLVQAASWSTKTINLAPAVKALNFYSGSLVPGLWDTWVGSNPGHLTAMPTHVTVLCVAYQPKALQAAGADMPTADWTLDQFEVACRLLQDAIKSGKLQKLGVEFVLPQMNAPQGIGLADINLWGSFILGFGGYIVSAGSVGVTSGAALEGIRRLIDLVQRYGSDPAAGTGAEDIGPSVAMAFTYLFPYALSPSAGAGPFRYARFPRLPVRSVVPADLGGRGLTFLPYGAEVAPIPSAVPDGILNAAARYFSWWYGRGPQQLISKAGHPPINAGLVSSFWSKYDMDIQAADFVFPDWAPYLKAVEPLPSLIPAVADPKQVPYILSQMAQRLNAGLMRAKLPSGAGGATPAQQASAARAFPTKGPGMAPGGG